MQLPASFQSEMKSLLGSEYEDWLASMNERPYAGLRVNTSKISMAEWEKVTPFRGDPVPWAANGFYVEAEERPALHPYHAAGLYYLQEPSAMLPAAILDVKPGEKVLDLCAAPGGKSTEFGSRLKERGGLLVSNDISHSRARALVKNLARWGITDCLVTCEEPEKLAGAFGPVFDRILVDAPCSGEGMFRKDPSLIRHFEEQGPKEYAPLQKKILSQAVRMLKPGGELLYSTCTFSVEEDEEVVNWLLKEEPSLTLVPIPLFEGAVGGVNGEKVIRLYPHKVRGEGHFAAHFKKEGEEAGAGEASGAAGPKRFFKRGDEIYLLPEGVTPPSGLRYLGTGLYVGEFRHDRLKPSQAAAMAADPQSVPSFSLPVSDERVRRYLKGETIRLSGGETLCDGTVLFCVDGFALGWLGVKGGHLKNLIAPGWIDR